MTRKLFRLFCISALVCGFASCQWHEAKAVIALADSLDRTEHIIHDDTVALRGVIRILDNPLERWIHKNTLGKAYYYMGRNLSLSNCIAEAAKCYVEADRLQIDDPIIRGRVNSCMAHICVQNNCDSLALIFYNRANYDFKESDSEWRYAQNLLSISECYIFLHQYNLADSLLNLALYPLDSSYQARYYETRGLFFYQQQQYDSALVYFERGLNYWSSKEEKCYCYLKIMQIFLNIDHLESSILYAQHIVQESNNPNYLVNAYYTLLLDAKEKNDTDLLSKYTHVREDMNRELEKKKEPYTQALTIIKEYLLNPYPYRKIQITLICIVFLCIFSMTYVMIYRRHNRVAHAQIDMLSEYMQIQQRCLNENKQMLNFENNRLCILNKYHTPHKRWRNYLLLKRDIDPWLHDWLQAIDSLSLSEQEKIFCAINLIYPHMTDVEIADFICYSKDGIRVFKNRILKKLGVASVNFADFLRNLSVSK